VKEGGRGGGEVRGRDCFLSGLVDGVKAKRRKKKKAVRKDRKHVHNMSENAFAHTQTSFSYS